MPRIPSDVPDAILQLISAPGLGPRLLRRLRRHFASDESILRANPGTLRRVEGIGEARARAIVRAVGEVDVNGERRAMSRCGARIILAEDNDFPALLAATPDAPAALWVRGELRPDDDASVAIVGSRRCSAYGREQASRFGALLGGAGVTIVSGGAVGIDVSAHRGALRAGGRTIAVLGSGLGRPYPACHARLFDTIAESAGAVVSEFPMMMPPRPAHFPRRNRVISGLSLGTLVVEAGRRSGALITARIAVEEHGRDAWVVTDRIDTPASRGGLEAVRDGWAGLVTSLADVATNLAGAASVLRGAREMAGERSSGAGLPLTDPQRSMLAVLDAAAPARVAVDRLALETEQPIERTLADLTRLELLGEVRRDSAGVRRSRGAG